MNKELLEIINEKPDYNFVGFGTIKFASRLNLPHAHFLFNRTENGLEAICLEYGIVAHSDKAFDCAMSLAKTLLIFIKENNVETLSSLATDSIQNLSELWTEYKKIQFTLTNARVRNTFLYNKNYLRKSSYTIAA